MKMKGLVALLLQRMIALYMDDCRVRNLRPKTMDSYEKTLKLLARWLREEQGIDRWESVREPHIWAYSHADPSHRPACCTGTCIADRYRWREYSNNRTL